MELPEINNYFPKNLNMIGCDDLNNENIISNIIQYQ